ncbi:MAG TPA: divalent-cation tolerance protein CutA [Thermoplasmata archaeon]|nr:divalent-cation tolerance protein CutA [Thermoplasmata archaeon]
MTVAVESAPSGDDVRLVLTTFPDRRTARRIARTLIDERTAVCVHLVPIEATYVWKGEVEEAKEWLAVFKTVASRVRGLMRRLAEEHPYEVPEIAELRAGRVAGPYARYLRAELEPGPKGRPTRRGGPRGRAAPRLGRTRGRRPPP